MAHNLPFENRNGTIYISTAANPVFYSRERAAGKGHLRKKPSQDLIGLSAQIKYFDWPVYSNEA